MYSSNERQPESCASRSLATGALSGLPGVDIVKRSLSEGVAERSLEFDATPFDRLGFAFRRLLISV
jgi:hypothetical protein